MVSTEGIEIPDAIQIPEQEQDDPNTPIWNFLKNKENSTLYSYRGGLFHFFDFIMKKKLRIKIDDKTKKEIAVDPKIYFPQYEMIALKYLASKRNHGHDLKAYAQHLKDTKTNPKTSHIRIVSVREFFSKYDIVIDDKTKKEIRSSKPKIRVSTNFKYIDRKILGELLAHGDARFRAFVLTAASSGARLNEILSLVWSDISIPNRTKYPEKPASAFIRESKTGPARTVYISRECEAALSEWKKVYKDYRDFATRRAENFKSPDKEKKNDDTRVFPFDSNGVYWMWNRALKNAGYDDKDSVTKRTRMNVHRLRNFFSVQVASATGDQVSEYLLGHADKYGDAYKGRSEEDWEQAYRKAEPFLTIGIQTHDAEQERQIKEIMQENTSIRQENQELKKQMEELKRLQEIKVTAENHELYKKIMADVEAKLIKK